MAVEASAISLDDHRGRYVHESHLCASRIKYLWPKSVIDEAVHLDPTIGWDRNVLSYFDYHMTQCEFNDQVLHGAGIKVTVEVRIEYEWIAELEFNEDAV